MSERNEILSQLLEEIEISLRHILRRFRNIQSSDDFLADDAGIDKLDAISMRLIAIGEAFKQIDKLTDKRLLPRYPEIDWEGVKGIRDILSHHYFDIDAEIIYHVCDRHVPELLETVRRMKEGLSEE